MIENLLYNKSKTIPQTIHNNVMKVCKKIVLLQYCCNAKKNPKMIVRIKEIISGACIELLLGLIRSLSTKIEEYSNKRVNKFRNKKLKHFFI